MKIYDPKKILVPVDFSEFSKGVLRAAVEIAEKWDAEALVLHAAKESDYAPAMPGGMAAYEGYAGRAATVFPGRSKLLEDARAQLESRLEGMMRQAAAGPKVRAEVAWGDPLKEILRAAEAEDCDLIVMATHGRQGLSRFLLGSITEQVIRRAPCPVLAVRAKVAEERLVRAEMGQESTN
ncbi:MAG: universal stress protein [Candidatus Tectomicrobia bacterium]|nr:universal stress protein [Candidatus Tectomicrobia bacterium]